jgi:MoxR-like ATPase
VWGAGFVFFDEINRCRPDLQNKMFPLVHERRIGGVDLPDLVHRWAAMNPPHAGEDLGGYLGTEPLDTALADRFWLVVRTPGWAELTRSERTALVDGSASDVDPAVLRDALARTHAALPGAEADVGTLATRYVVMLTDTLAHGGIAISPRRASILRRTIVATVAAGRALGRTDDPAAVFELVVRNGLPQLAEAEPPAQHRIVAAHLQAYDLAREGDDGIRRTLLEEPDAVRRVHLALEHGADEPLLASTVTSALSAQPTPGEQGALAAVLHLALAEHDLTPAAWSAIAQGAATSCCPTRTSTACRPAGRSSAGARRPAGWPRTGTRRSRRRCSPGSDRTCSSTCRCPSSSRACAAGWRCSVSTHERRPRAGRRAGRTDAPMGDGPVGDGLLGNMSSRPRTEIRRDVPAVQQGWVLFDLTARLGRLPAGTEPDVLTPEQLARLDARWHALGLSGATLVIRSRARSSGSSRSSASTRS